MLCKPLFEDLLNERFMSMYELMLVCLTEPLIVKLLHSVCMSMHMCVCFVECVHGLNECMCYVCACVCLCKLICAVYV